MKRWILYPSVLVSLMFGAVSTASVSASATQTVKAIKATPTMDDIYHFFAMPLNIGTAGQPTPEQFGQIAEAGFTVVVNLAMPDSENALPDEGRLVSETGMTYVHIPVPWEAPSPTHLRQFFAVMDALQLQQQRVFVHCAANSRVSAFVYKYLTLRHGVSEQEASTLLLQRWLPRMDANWRSIYNLEAKDLISL